MMEKKGTPEYHQQKVKKYEAKLHELNRENLRHFQKHGAFAPPDFLSHPIFRFPVEKTGPLKEN